MNPVSAISDQTGVLKPVVFVVDDDVSVRESIQGLLDFAGFEAVTFGSAHEFLGAPHSHSPNCLLLDIGLPDLSGLDLQELVAGDRSDMPIIVITGRGDVPMTVRAMKAGAVEVLTKPFDNEVLLDAIRHAIERSRAVQERHAEIRAVQNRHASLSKREHQVMDLIVSGLLNKQVGYELGISEITVKVHRAHVMEKMQARTFADLVKMAGRLGADQK
jgi:FixJ family two-component response regulator